MEAVPLFLPVLAVADRQRSPVVLDLDSEGSNCETKPIMDLPMPGAAWLRFAKQGAFGYWPKTLFCETNSILVLLAEAGIALDGSCIRQ